MARYEIDRRQLIADLEVVEPILKREAEQVMREERFLPAVARLQEEFMESKVTQELLGGVGASNESGTLQGEFRDDEGDSPANLYSFIGFDIPPEQVIGPILQRLDPEHKDGPKMVYKGRDKSTARSEAGSRLSLRYEWEISGPNEAAIADNTPFPESWLDGDVSWVQRIERGIPGLAHFLNVYGRPASRSGGGVQIEGVLRSGRYRPVPYLSRMLNNFLRRVAEKAENGRGV